MSDILEIVKQKCEKEGVKLLYLTKFGSHLYGTNTENSDTDYKGIFLPSKEQCILGKQPKNMNWSTGDGNSRNTKEDYDFSLWSLQYFMKLVSEGETNALDLLYSISYPKVVEYSHTSVYLFFQNNHSQLFNIKDCKSFVGYAIGQAKKYGIKGSRLGVLKKVYDIINDEKYVNFTNKKLIEIIDDIIEECYDPSFCFVKNINDIKSLIICGKVHQGNITLEEFYNRIRKEYNKYGDRAKLAEQNKGIDWKAISHAKRSLDQMKMLMCDGEIKYPLPTADEILKIKNGEVDFKIISEEIANEIDEIDNTINDTNFVGFHKKDQDLINDFILSFYE